MRAAASECSSWPNSVYYEGFNSLLDELSGIISTINSCVQEKEEINGLFLYLVHSSDYTFACNHCKFAFGLDTQQASLAT